MLGRDGEKLWDFFCLQFCGWVRCGRQGWFPCFPYVPPTVLSLSSYVKAFVYLAWELESKDGAAYLAVSVGVSPNAAQCGLIDRYMRLCN
jgi:hypothetical protein